MQACAFMIICINSKFAEWGAGLSGWVWEVMVGKRGDEEDALGWEDRSCYLQISIF
jgi:hypothetical protein